MKIKSLALLTSLISTLSFSRDFNIGESFTNVKHECSEVEVDEDYTICYIDYVVDPVILKFKRNKLVGIRKNKELIAQNQRQEQQEQQRIEQEAQLAEQQRIESNRRVGQFIGNIFTQMGQQPQKRSTECRNTSYGTVICE